MDRVDWIPGRRVVIDGVGEGTVVESKADQDVEVAVSEIETYLVSKDKVHDNE